ncbi:MAG: ATP-dependent RNA helicase HrpA [Desulfosarcinaceae bacterium]
MRALQQQIDAISRQLGRAMLADQAAARRELKLLRRALDRGKDNPDSLQKRCERLATRVQNSVRKCKDRRAHAPRIAFDEHLPIMARKEELLEKLSKHQVLIVAGETGSGKTTQLPKLCLLAGRGIRGCIGVTQPRRIAATSVGLRIAEELGEKIGRTVAYKIRFKDTTGPVTRIKIMTDGILLSEAHRDHGLYQYDTLIVDEAHERSLNIDFILGLLKRLIQKRKDLKLIITSATIDTQKFSQAFGGAPVVEVSGKIYPVETRYYMGDPESEEEASHIELSVQALDQLRSQKHFGDVLMFMPTEQDIRDTCELLEGRRYPGAQIIPLFARLSAAEQQKVFKVGNGQRIIVATNVAETSITIPGIRAVIDSGLARILQYTPRSRTTTLPVLPVSQSSADQRKGRCGRLADGICIRLYCEEDYDNRPRYSEPEILRCNLAEVILRMIALGLGDVEAFPFIDAPSPRSIHDGYNLLEELGAIRPLKTARGGQGRYALTPKGRLMAQLPLDPRLACMLLEARSRGCLGDVAILAAALSIQDPRERPMEKQAQADRAQARFADPLSDFIGLLRIWHTYDARVRKRKRWAEVKAFCRDHFLSMRRMREWQDIHQQIRLVLEEHGITAGPAPPGDERSWLQ